MTDFPTMELEAKLSIDYIDCATQIELTYGNLLLPAPEGVYMKGRVDPVIQAGRKYYVRRGSASEQITSLEGIKENIYDEQTKLVIPKTYLQQAHNYISNTPYVPYRGAKLVELLTNEYLESFVHYKRWDVDYRERILRHFNAAEIGEEVVIPERFKDLYGNDGLDVERYHPFDKIEVEMGDIFYLRLLNEIKLFLGEKRWYMYNVYVSGNLLHIERYCDWRAWQWEQANAKNNDDGEEG